MLGECKAPSFICAVWSCSLSLFLSKFTKTPLSFCLSSALLSARAHVPLPHFVKAKANLLVFTHISPLILSTIVMHQKSTSVWTHHKTHLDEIRANASGHYLIHMYLRLLCRATCVTCLNRAISKEENAPLVSKISLVNTVFSRDTFFIDNSQKFCLDDKHNMRVSDSNGW